MKLLVLLLAVGLAAADESCQRQCSRIYAPVCTTDGHTATNKCEFQVYQCEQRKINMEVAIAHEGKCKKPVTGCPEMCPAIYAPVCGSDGKTYDNDCHLEVASCNTFKQNGVDIKLAHGGVCKEKRSEEEECGKSCPRILRPVCASNGQTFGNECLFQIFQCQAQKNGDEVVLVHEGECQSEKRNEEEESCGRRCPKILRPVCASDGQTFGNECLFQIFQCQAQKNGDEVVLVHEGECQSRKRNEEEESCGRRCPKILRPVCASNGQTFGNECLFQIFQCQAQKNGDEVVLVHEGEC